MASLAALLLLCPLLFIVAALVRGMLGSPVLFRQERPGLHEKPFIMLKFRTMTDRRDRTGSPLPDAERLTRFGRFLRGSSLDELPELFNVLKGDMSLVGPRPLLMRYLPYYSKRERLRHTVRPGITGWAQVNGRNLLGWDQRLECDAWYVENRSFKMDLLILARTLTAVFRRKGMVADPRSVMLNLDEERRGKGDSQGRGGQRP